LVRLGATPEGLLAAVVLGVLGVLTVIDLEHRLLPNRIVGPAAITVLLLQAGLFPGRLVECIIAAACTSLLLLLPALLRRNALGMGDVKLAGVLGAALGGKVLAALTLGSLASAPVALFLLLRGTEGRSATLPFGPFLTFGTAVVLLT
jgi:leader peptidase (prepilin peptidase)/N-methyltransferase